MNLNPKSNLRRSSDEAMIAASEKEEVDGLIWQRSTQNIWERVVQVRTSH